MLGFGALGQLALGQLPSRSATAISGFSDPPIVRRISVAALTAFSTLVLATTSGATNTSPWKQQPLNPEVFARPFPAHLQQYVAHGPEPVPTAITPHGWEGEQLERRFAKPFPVAAQQYAAHIPEHVRVAEDSEGFYPQPPDVFAKPFPVASQQYTAFQPAGRIRSSFPDGWSGFQWSYAFAVPLSVTAQQFLAHADEHVPEAAEVEGWFGEQLEHAFARPFPIASQQYSNFTPRGSIRTAFPQGFWGYQFDIQFAKPFPVSQQQYEIKAPRPVATGIEFQFYPEPPVQFAKPFPVASQIFSVWDLVGEVPEFKPPGSGRRKDFPSYIPEPPYDVKPRKPFKPIWDRGGKVEEPEKPAVVAPAGPPPLPPLSIFGQPAPMQVMSPSGLPTFNEFVPHDAMATAKRLQQAQDESDAIAVLRALGLFKDEG
jgi:hypothetical protein